MFRQFFCFDMCTLGYIIYDNFFDGRGYSVTNLYTVISRYFSPDRNMVFGKEG